jgi:acetate kinase
MGTRPGSLDPGVVLHLIEQKGMTPAEVGHLLYHESGLLGLSGISNDVRELLTSQSRDAAMAIDYFCLHTAQAIAGLAVSAGGLDALVFTAGIGENAPQIRQRVVDHLGWWGLALDADANRRNGTRIDATGSKARVFVIPTDEELMIGRHTLRLLKEQKVADFAAAPA